MPQQRDQWILTAPCGCPQGVMEGYLAKDEDAAFLVMYDEAPSRANAAKERGMEIRLISFEEYTTKFYDLMYVPCPH